MSHFISSVSKNQQNKVYGVRIANGQPYMQISGYRFGTNNRVMPTIISEKISFNTYLDLLLTAWNLHSIIDADESYAIFKPFNIQVVS